MSDPTPATAAYAPSDSAAALVQVLDEYLAALQTDQAPQRAEVLARHPELAAQLDSCLAAIEFIYQAGLPAAGEAPARLGDFLILGELGRGGMGVVYEAEQLSLKPKVALKVLRFGGTADPSAMDRFRREAETVARLHHTNIVPVFAVGCEQDVHYYATQLIDGEGLDRAAARLKPNYGMVARWGVQAAEALAHAHARGVIHRDIKPSNLLLDREGTVWLTDFGLARRSDEAALTLSGVLMGTPRYMSPEQAAADGEHLDPNAFGRRQLEGDRQAGGRRRPGLPYRPVPGTAPGVQAVQRRVEVVHERHAKLLGELARCDCTSAGDETGRGSSDGGRGASWGDAGGRHEKRRPPRHTRGWRGGL